MKKAQDNEKKVKTNTYNYPPDSHKEFCKRCLKYNNLICPMPGTRFISNYCNV